jgi:glycosyltransferase involved in cell wall biosynthesis
VSGRVAEAVLRSADVLGTATPSVLLYAPLVETNPFQALLYGGLWDVGIAPVGCPELEALRAAEVAIRAGGRAAVHVHWTYDMTRRATSAAHYREMSTSFLSVVDELRGQGVPVLWTVHNPTEHDSAFVDDELAFRSQLAARVDVIHVMSPLALDELARHFTVPADKVLSIPHPAYLGVYPEYVTRSDARMRLGFSADDLVVGVVGALRPYKRIGAIHAACREAPAHRRVRLLCAGALGNQPAVLTEAEALRRDPWAELVNRRLDDRELSTAVAACDIVWCGYDSPMTSGVSLLAMGLARPVLLPDRPISRELAGPAGVYVDPFDSGALADVLRRLDPLDLRRRGELARRRAEEFRHELVGARFAAAVRELV